jgi:hypothetical protein
VLTGLFVRVVDEHNSRTEEERRCRGGHNSTELPPTIYTVDPRPIRASMQP